MTQTDKSNETNPNLNTNPDASAKEARETSSPEKPETEAPKPEKDERDLFAKDWDQHIGTNARSSQRQPLSRTRKHKRKNIVVPSLLLALALAGSSLGASWYLGTHGNSGHLNSLKMAEQKQYDEYTAWLNGLSKPSEWDEATFEAIKAAALNAYDKTQLEKIDLAISGDKEAEKSLEETSGASDQSTLQAYKDLLENASQYPQNLVQAAVSDPGLLQFVLAYPQHANSQGSEVTLGDVTTMPDLKTFDPNWGYMSYGDGIFALTGSAPTAISDVFSYILEDPTLTPYTIGKWAEQYEYDKTPIRETDDSIFGGAALTWGVSMNPVPAYKTQISTYVSQGYPMIIALGSIEQPKFYVLDGVDENGNWKAFDPSSSNSPVSMNPDETADQIVKAYAFW